MTVHPIPGRQPLTASAAALWATHRDPECRKCPMHQNSDGKAVCLFGNGPARATGMVITDVPAQRDEMEGLPMAEGAPHADYLRTVFRELDIDLDAMYLTYAAKCRPPYFDSERDKQLKLAQKECSSYLDLEVKAVQPKAVLAMGAPSLYFFTHMGGITKRRGQAFFDPKYDCWVVPTVHPRYVLQYPQYHSAFLSDVALFDRFRRGVFDAPKVHVEEVVTLEAVRDLKAKVEACSGMVTYDVETRGFVDYRPGFSRLWCAAFCLGERDQHGALVSYLIPVEHPDSPFLADYEAVREVALAVASMALDGERRNGHNIKFDRKHVLRLRERYEAADDETVEEWTEEMRTRSVWTDDVPREKRRKRLPADILDDLERLAARLAEG